MSSDGWFARRYGTARSAVEQLFDQSQPFGRLALVHSLQGAGGTFITISLAGSLFFSISPTAAKGKVLLYLVLTIAPFALVGPALSPLLDRGRQARRTSVAVASGGSAVLCFLMARNIHDLLLFPEAFGILVLSKLYLVARAALVPAMISPGDDLATANAKLAVLASLAGFAAFPPGLVLLKIGGAWVLRFGAVVFAAGMVAAFRLPRPSLEAPGVEPEPPPPWPDPRPGLERPSPAVPAATPTMHPREVAEARRRLGLPLYPSEVTAGLSAMSVARATVGFTEFFLAFGLRRAHAGTWWFGLMLVASAVGSLVGALVVPRLRRRLSERQIISVSLAAIAVGAFLATVIGGLLAQALLTLAVGVGPTSAKPALDSIVQRHVPPALLGRAFGRLETRLQLIWVLAALVAVVIPFPLRAGDLTVAIACVIALVIYLASANGQRIGQRIGRRAPS